MTEYALYLESGPRHRKTMVHVLDLLGCIAQGPTTEGALEATPEAIRAYLRFLQRHGEAIEPEDAFTSTVAIHVTDGQWLGNGDPDSGFAPDFQPLLADDLKIYVRRLSWIRSDLLDLVHGLSSKQLVAQPASGGRPIRRILEHVAGAQYGYLQSPVTKPSGLAAAVRAVEQGPDLFAALNRVWQMSSARLEGMTEAERVQKVQHGQRVWTARRALRRMLEHDWEHLLEVSARLNRVV